MRLRRKTRFNWSTDATPRMMRILAIDPGTRIMGYADFEDYHLIDYGLKLFKPATKIENLLNDIQNVFERLILEKQPSLIILEKNRFSQITNNIRLTLAIARIKTVAKEHSVRLIEYAPNTVRSVISNNGYATKSELSRAVVNRYPELRIYVQNQSPSSLNTFFNITDAVACGLTYLDLISKTP
ncbi:MAG: crossover junction endodeoxyribonuclease RuvC [Candidatus Zixiibacteriota bacterium]